MFIKNSLFSNRWDLVLSVQNDNGFFNPKFISITNFQSIHLLIFYSNFKICIVFVSYINQINRRVDKTEFFFKCNQLILFQHNNHLAPLFYNKKENSENVIVFLIVL